ncbi:hypothetical protein FQA39_LY06186 [Lamprigera yunnana]|nr:hypothetical protein FQA39_LY06186 [Lamprigera yunnana]
MLLYCTLAHGTDNTPTVLDKFKRTMIKVDQRKWSPIDTTKAINAVRNKKMGCKKASKQFNVPKTTLMRMSDAKYGTSEEASNTKRGRPRVLGKNLEDQLVHYFLAKEAS